MTLANLLNTFKTQQKQDGVLGDLNRYLITSKRRADIGRPYEGRAQGVHHPSSLSSVDCVRQLVYGWLKTPKSNIHFTEKTRRIFDTGHDFGYRMQAYFWDMGLLLGEWYCIQCSHNWLDLDNPSPKSCPNCKVKLEIWYNLHYLEVPIINKARNLMGKCDGILKRPWGRQLVEFKTIKNRDSATGRLSVCFEDLSEPKSQHVAQLLLYMDGALSYYEQHTEQDFKSGVIIYNGKNDHSVKEFVIKMESVLLQKVYIKAELVEQSLKDSVLPIRGGENKTCYVCKFCEYQDFCWTEHTFLQADNRKNM